LFFDLVGDDSRLVRLKEAEDVLVVDGFLAIGELSEAVVDLVELFASKGVAEFFETVCKGAAAAVFAENEISVGYAYGGGRHDLVGEWVGHHSMLVDAGLVSEGVGSDYCFVGSCAEANAL
jgi:hypothetical protein